jgi:hypothetical protein
MSRQEILERERRWRVPVAVASFVGIALLVASGFVQSEFLTEETNAEQFAAIDQDSGKFMLGSVMAALGFLSLLGPLLYVFQAARARSDAVRGAMIGIVVLGPVLMGVQNVVQATGLKQVAADYVSATEAAPATLELASVKELEKPLAETKGIEEVSFYPGADAAEIEASDGFRTIEFPADEEDAVRDRLEKEDFTFTEEEDGDPGDAQIEALSDDASVFKVGANLLFPAFIALIVAIFYTSLQAMRTGLFTRFFGTLCMALSVAILLLGALLPTAVIFLAGTALVILGRTPRGRPPAWDTGEAMPWPKPGEEEARGAADVLEGDATEVDDDGDDSESPHSERRQRAKRKKRKRR